MPFQLSPGVAVVEKDFSSIVPAVSSSAGAYCGPFAWGPIEDPVRVSSETDLVTRFGAPNDSNFQSFFTAANFLAYANNLLVTRTDAANLKNAVAIQSGSISQGNVVLLTPGAGYAPGAPGEVPTVTIGAPQVVGGTQATATVTYTDAEINSVLTRTITGITIVNQGSGYTSAPSITISSPAAGTAATAQITSVSTGGVKIKNITSYLDAYNTGAGVFGEFAAKFAGTKGNGLRVVVLDAGSWASASADIKALFNGAPGTSTFAEAYGISDDEVHVAIFDTPRGTFSGVADVMLEKYSFLSKLSDAKRSDGSNNYYKSAINSQSKYIWWMDHTSLVSEAADVNVVDNVAGGATASINGTNKTITIADTEHFTKLAAFKTYYDAAPDKASRQVLLAGSVNNNKVVTVTNIATTVVGGNITAYTLTVSETVTTETVANILITSVSKSAWVKQHKPYLLNLQLRDLKYCLQQ